jgi:hypothetical protein
MRAEDAGAAGAVLLEAPAELEEHQVLVVPGDRGRGQQARGPMAEMGAADGAKSLGGAVHEIGPGPAVDVEIDVTGDEIPTLRRARR